MSGQSQAKLLEERIADFLRPQGFQDPQFKAAAETALEQGDINRARKICEEGMLYIEKKCEYDSGGLFRAAELALLINDYDRAIKYYETNQNYVACARTTKESGNNERAKQFYGLALEKARHNYEDQNTGGHTLFKLIDLYTIVDEMGDVNATNAYYEQLIHLAEEERDLLGGQTHVAEIAEKRGDLPRAIIYYQRGDYLGNAARVAHYAGDISQRQRLFERIINAFHGSKTVNQDEMVEADETYWRAFFMQAQQSYRGTSEYTEAEKLSRKLNEDCNLGKANVYQALVQTLFPMI